MSLKGHMWYTNLRSWRDVPVLAPEIPVLDLDDFLLLPYAARRLHLEVACALREEAHICPAPVPLPPLDGVPFGLCEGDVVQPACYLVRHGLPLSRVLWPVALDLPAVVVVDNPVQQGLAGLRILGL